MSTAINPEPTASLSTACYANPFLTQVILRVDFGAYLERVSTSSNLAPEVLKAILPHFPIPEPQPTVAQEVQIKGSEVTTIEKKHTTWNFHGRNREKVLTITPQFLWVQRMKYTTWEELKQEFFDVLNPFLAVYKDTVISRVGLRYINEITLNHSGPTEWSGYVDPELLCVFKFFSKADPLSRAFNVVDLNFDDLQLRFQYGMHNPDYPALIRRKSFILDLDAYYVGLLEGAELAANVDRAHARIQEIFERSITEKLRAIMNEHS
jgi:uncharacterized protein (TIGR04255 family)